MLNNTPKISIIIPVFNLEGYITKCIQSLLQQTYSNIEIIIIDDGSTDKSWSIIQSLVQKDNRIVAKHQNNGGTARARNAALELVSGDYVTFVDGDDTLIYNTLDKNIKYLIEDNELDWVSFPVIRVDEYGNRKKNTKDYNHYEISTNQIVNGKDFLSYFYERKLSGLCCGTIYRWSSISNIRFPAGEYYEDSFFFCETLWTTQKGMLSSVGQYLYLERSGSSQSAEMDEPHLLSTLHSAERKIRHFKDTFPEELNLITKIEDDYYYFFKLFSSKKIIGSKKIYLEYCNNFHVPHRRKWLTEIKLIIYKIVGYKNIRKFTKLFLK